MRKRLICLNLALLLMISLIGPVRKAEAFQRTVSANLYMSYEDRGEYEHYMTSISSDLINHRVYEYVKNFFDSGMIITSFNTEPDGSGEKVRLSDSIYDAFSKDVGKPRNLYAQWEEAPNGCVLYISSKGLLINGDDYFLQKWDNNDETLTVAENPFGVGTEQFIGWDLGYYSTYFSGRVSYSPGDKIVKDEYPYIVMFAHYGQNKVTLHCENSNGDKREVTYAISEGDSFQLSKYYGENRKEIFVGLNSKEDGSGLWYRYDKSYEWMPSDLYEIYEERPQNPYCIVNIDESDDDQTKPSKEIKILDNGTVYLPDKTGKGKNIVLWGTTLHGGYTSVYTAGSSADVGSGEELFPFIIEADEVILAINLNNEMYPRYYVYKYTPLYGDMLFGELIPNIRNYKPILAFISDSSQRKYELSDEIREALESENENTSQVIYFTTETEEVSGYYVQFIGDGAYTSEGNSTFIIDNLEAGINILIPGGEKFEAPNGKIFLGWSKHAGADLYDGFYQAGDQFTVKMNDNVYLYAKWGKNCVVYHDKDLYDEYQAEMNQDIIDFYLSSRNTEDRLFAGWNDSPDGNGNWYCYGDIISKNTVLNLYSQYIEPQSDGYFYAIAGEKIPGTERMAQVFEMDSEEQEIVFPDVKAPFWSTIEYQYFLGFMDELPLCVRPGDSIKVKSGTIFVPIDSESIVEYNENHEAYSQKRLQICYSSGASLLEYGASDVFDEVPSDSEFKGWNTKSDGTGETYTVGDHIAEGFQKLFAMWTKTEEPAPVPPSPPSYDPGYSNDDSDDESSTPPVTTTTQKNPDGSVTTTTKDYGTGTVTKKTEYSDGSSETLETRKNGTTVETVETADGVKGVTEKTKSGRITGSSAAVPEDAVRDGPVMLPVETAVAAEGSNSPELTVTVPEDAGSITVEVPFKDPKDTLVAVEVQADGTEVVLGKAVIQEDSVLLPVEGDTRVRFRDRSRTFTDVPDSNWASKAVGFAAARGILNGTGGDAFEPAVPMTRSMLAMMLFNLENKPAPSGGNSFSDVVSGSWYADAVSWAVGAGVVHGYDTGLFGPSDVITREQLAMMLWNYTGNPAPAGSLQGFPDAGKVSDYATDAMRWAVENGLVSGTGDHTLNPQGSATRAEVAQLLMNFIQSGIPLTR